MKTVQEALVWASAQLQQAGIPQPWFEAQLLMSFCLDCQVIKLVCEPQLTLSHEHLSQFREHVLQRQRRKPLAYITGKKSFLNWEFKVNENVLVPRPETETLVLLAQEQVTQTFPHQPLHLADIGTGSGIIGLSMLSLLPSAILSAVDISPEALLVARENAEELKVGNRVSFYVGDLLEPLECRGFHCITANLPYIPEGEYLGLEREVSFYEPKGALVAGADGLRLYRRLLRDVWDYLVPDGLLFVEIGWDQGEQVSKLFTLAGFKKPTIEKDLAGKDRIVWAKA